LLGITLHPGFTNNRLFYLYVTDNKEGTSVNQIQQWQLSEDYTSANKVKIIYDDIKASRNHNGGRIAFGPDNMLYVGTGDASDPRSAQDPESPNGKLLRLTPDGEIPGDNPRKGNPLFLMGIRNTQGWAWPDANNANKLWITDHGPSGDLMRIGHDEVSIVTANSNLGWPEIYKCESKEGLITPSLVWQNSVPPGGAALYTGNAIPEWKGNLIVATLGSRLLQRIIIENENVISHEVYFRDKFGRLREAIMSPEGDLYVTTSNCDDRGNCPGDKDRILRITK
jgi:glucose/arabinose dehydrogenase